MNPSLAPPLLDRLVHRISVVGDRLSRPPLDGLSGCDPIVVTRLVAKSASEATVLLNRTHTVPCGRGRRVRTLDVEPLRADPSVLGRAWVAAAAVSRRRSRPLGMTVAILDHSRNRCVVRVAPDRTPWMIRSLRRRLASTHDAADAIIEMILAVDFSPPDRPLDDPPGFEIFARGSLVDQSRRCWAPSPGRSL